MACYLCLDLRQDTFENGHVAKQLIGRKSQEHDAERGLPSEEDEFPEILIPREQNPLLVERQPQYRRVRHGGAGLGDVLNLVTELAQPLDKLALNVLTRQNPHGSPQAVATTSSVLRASEE
jgi:hypothetical protein